MLEIKYFKGIQVLQKLMDPGVLILHDRGPNIPLQTLLTPNENCWSGDFLSREQFQTGRPDLVAQRL